MIKGRLAGRGSAGHYVNPTGPGRRGTTLCGRSGSYQPWSGDVCKECQAKYEDTAPESGERPIPPRPVMPRLGYWKGTLKHWQEVMA